MEVDAVEISLTDFCNQNCGFCFAREEMYSAKKKYLSFENFRMLIKKLKKNNIMTLYLIGGEPTIHPEFIPMMRYALKHFFSLYLFSNGIFSKKIADFLCSVSPRISIQFNISTPGFLQNKNIQQLVVGNIKQLAPKTDVVLAINSLFQSTQDVKKNIKIFDKKLLKQLEICLCFSKPIAGDKNPITLDDFPAAGKNIIKSIKYVSRFQPKHIDLLAGQTYCMFTKKDRDFLKRVNIQFRQDCHLGFNDRWFSITPNLETFTCFSLSTKDRIQINQKSDLKKVKDRFLKLQYKYTKELVLSKCKSCPFYGIGENKCSGPCLAFRINALREENIKSKNKG